MAETYSVPLSQVVSQFDLEVAWRSTDYDKIQITVADVARPGLQIAGYFDHFEPMRLQVIGNVESSYLDKMNSAERLMVYDRLFSYKIPALIAARGLVPGSECLEMAKKHNITILRWPGSTSSIVSSIIAYLTRELAPRITRHGVLMEIYGEGVLLTGDSGIGKSEAAVELLKKLNDKASLITTPWDKLDGQLIKEAMDGNALKKDMEQLEQYLTETAGKVGGDAAV